MQLPCTKQAQQLPVTLITAIVMKPLLTNTYGSNTLSQIQTCITIIKNLHDLDHLQQTVLMTALAVSQQLQ